MIGLPTVMTAWIPNYFYPLVPDEDSDNPMYQHLFLIAIVGWLITVGPKRKGETAIAHKEAGETAKAHKVA
jgi:hypothetical protein